MSATFAGGGEMGALMRAFDWSRTPIGPVSGWPQSLKTAVRIILSSRYAMFVWWGRDLVNLYNDPYRSFLGIKHPDALGKSARDIWAEIWDQIGPRTEAVLLRGESTYDEDLLLLMERHGYPEETYFTFSYSPLLDDDGRVAGLFCAVTEETHRVIGERRLALLRDVAAATADARSPSQACQSAAQAMSRAMRDLPFSLIYLVDEDGRSLKRAGAAGIHTGHPAAPDILTLDGPETFWPWRQVLESEQPVVVNDLRDHMPNLPAGEWSRGPECAILAPIAQQGQSRPAGILIAGLNPHRNFDYDFRRFVSLLTNQIAAAVANAVAFQMERQRAEELGELDRAKTAFFSNVSHEFRTPLTLMLGPLEDALSDSSVPAHTHARIQTAHRNSLRLLKLVNTLLDFSRIESGRVQALYSATDLAAFTVEVAGVFRSAMENAGLHFSVACDQLAEPVYVDRHMWEKIVLNLLSNAFKFTFDGEVALTLKVVDGSVELAVRDTGVGIPDDELHRVFERFHRIENSRARTYEGTGIGLALVHELVKLHGGTVRVESVMNRGSTFTVSVPLGKAHLPADRVLDTAISAFPSLAADAYVGEAQRWLLQDSDARTDEPLVPDLSMFPEPASSKPAEERDLIVLAEDNADMRHYLGHLLGQRYRIHAVSDGAQAIDAIRRLKPALALADVMMPKLDGFGVVHAIRNDASLRATPVILLSARAGEESRVEGLQAGADDYLVKPFTARELISRVATQLRMSRLRREAAESEARLRTETERARYEALRDSERSFRDFVESASVPMHWVGPDGVILWANQAELDMLGYTREEYVGRHIADFHADAPAIDDIMQRLGRGETLHEHHARLRAKNGAIRHVLIDSSVLFQNGRFVHTRCFTRDITERKEAEETRAKLAAIVESSDDAIVSKDLNGIVTSWNRCAERMFGYTAQEMIGRPITTIIPPELHDDERRILNTIARGERIEHFETVRLTKGGERIEVSLTISPVRDQAGTIIGAAKIARDITERNKTERALRTSERIASVGRLAATVAHEINNPLEAVTNLVYLAKQRAVRPDVSEFLTEAEEELERIGHLTKQTLGFYRETRGAGPLRLGEHVNALLPVFASRIRNKKIQVDTEIRQDLEIRAVAGEVRQVVANLLSNSIDAVNVGGRIRLRISSVRDTSGLKTLGVRLTVADSGPGIPATVRARLFEPFFTTKRDIGTGLGLWVCKSIAEKHHGTIRVKSATTPGKSWTAFSVFLPLDGHASVEHHSTAA